MSLNEEQRQRVIADILRMARERIEKLSKRLRGMSDEALKRTWENLREKE